MSKVCVPLVPGVQACATLINPSTIEVELDLFGHKIWSAEISADPHCQSIKISVFPCTVSLEVCVVDGPAVTFKGEVCVAGKCANVDVKIPL